MENKKQIMHICTIQRGLGIVEGIASGLADDAVRQLLYTATEMIEEAVGEITNDGKRDAMDELVRCKDCKHAVDVFPPLVAEQKLACTKSVNWRAVEPDHFCSYGERREGE